MSPHSDEPVVHESSGAKYRLLVVLGVVVLLAALVFYPHMHRSWLENKSHEAERGSLQGALYEIPLETGTETIELGWAGDRLAVVMDEPPSDGATVRLKGSFGEETLAWNKEHELFGPTEARMNPYRHHQVSITIEADGRTLWSGKRWAVGIHDHSHHH